MAPLLASSMVAVSRTADNRRTSGPTRGSTRPEADLREGCRIVFRFVSFRFVSVLFGLGGGLDHWQDVTVGSLLGLGICEFEEGG